MEMYTTDALPAITDDRPVVSAFLVWSIEGSLSEALEKLESQAKEGGASASVGLRIAVADSTYYNPGNAYAGGVGAGYGGGTSWAAYGTALRRKGDRTAPEQRVHELQQKLYRGTPGLADLLTSKRFPLAD
ncbi:hypothetical protein ACFY2G_04275 [Streptomyces collinus]|uniref:hypothetical protein n=1 Tax=Streptomyces collinus TaxID=42684 RepID=UPI00368E3F5A